MTGRYATLAIDVMSGEFFDVEIAHKLGSDMPADGLAFLRQQYVSDVRANTAAATQVIDWWLACHFPPDDASLAAYEDAERRTYEGLIGPTDDARPTHDGPCTRSLDGDGEPLGYCAVCFQDMPTNDASS